MNAIALTPPVGNLTPPGAEPPTAAALPEAGFGEMLSTSMDRLNQVQAEADRAVEDLTLGRRTDIHDTMLAVEKAGIALELALQIRNKLLNAYESIMRQQI